MTAEIAIMNKEALALAADSAVTLREEKGQKIFTSANKIFTLSKYHPVGIMIYGSAKFMEVPWETIIKIYRNKLSKKKFDTLKEYADDFIDFMSKENRLFPELEQDKYLTSNIYSYFYYIRKNIEQKIEAKISDKSKIAKREIKEITSTVIKKHYDTWKKPALLPSVPQRYVPNLINKYRATIDKARKEVFENLPISKILSNRLTDIAGSLFAKFPMEVVHSGISGVVIAGFGKKDTFPSLQSFLLDGIANNFLKYREDKHIKIAFDNNATIVPFAQSEMVATFMEGVEPGYETAIENFLSRIFNEYPHIIIDKIDKIDDNEKKSLKEKLKEISNKEFKLYKKRLEDYRRKNFVEPVIKVVAMLPKDELAAMAESLVNLTSFKRKISMEAETVGGPIDVAVISKGDGFIWIKRKHYFKPELNPQFFANYYKEAENGKEKETR